MNSRFPQLKIKGSGASIPPGVKRLGPGCEPEDKVWWLNNKNEVEQGVLQEFVWDGDKCTAVVLKDTGSLHQYSTSIFL